MVKVFEKPVDMFKRPIVVGDTLVKAINKPKVELKLVTVTRVNGKHVFVNNNQQPIIYNSKHIVVTDLIQQGKSIGISE